LSICKQGPFQGVAAGDGTVKEVHRTQ
jgi:hypothetical protein